MAKGFLLIALIALGSACTQRTICPAYQSSFLYDQESLRQKFSYFNQDSTPKVYTASKTKNLIAAPESYRKRYRRLQTIEMVPVYPVKPDSLKPKDDFSLAETDSLSMDSLAMDSTGLKAKPDSIYAITKTKERYNLDQDLYMWYFREILVLPDVRAAMQKQTDEKNGTSASAKKEKKGFVGFFKNLFKKKPKNDSTSVDTPPQTLTDGTAEQPKKKKGGLFKRKENPTPPKKKEGGDGF